jgi:putative copper resistance protein D
MPQGALSYVQRLDVAFIYVGFALVLGSLASAKWLSGATSAWSDLVASQSLQFRRLGLVLSVAALGFSVWLQAAVMAEVPLTQAGPAVLKLARNTQFGHVAATGFAAWVLALAFGWAPARLTAARSLMLFLAVAAAFWSRSANSHAGAKNGLWSLAACVDWIHLVAACLWVGMVLLAARLKLPSEAATAQERAEATLWVGSLSSLATVSLAAVVLAGVFNVWHAVGDWNLLLGSVYGKALLVKLLLVAVAAALGGYNRFRVLPGVFELLRQPGTNSRDWKRTLVRVLRIEAVALLLVLVAATVLGSSEPPGA